MYLSIILCPIYIIFIIDQYTIVLGFVWSAIMSLLVFFSFYKWCNLDETMKHGDKFDIDSFILFSILNCLLTN
jgi:hypothetical protein